MSAATSIEWTDRTWNPVRGCSRVSEGCRNCYAEKTAGRFSGPGLAFEGFAKHVITDHTLGEETREARWTGRVELVPDALDAPLRWRKPQRIFVNSMSDLFHEALPAEAIDRVFAVMALARKHTFQILTKRPARMLSYLSGEGVAQRIGNLAQEIAAASEAQFSVPRDIMVCHVGPGAEFGYRWFIPWPLPNVWLGVSVEDQKTADERIPLLLDTPAAVRFVSYEPALGPVMLRAEWMRPQRGCNGQHRGPCGDGPHHHHDEFCGPRLDWIIAGGESGPGARPFDIAWARSVVAQCKAAGVPVFVKQLGARPFQCQGEGACQTDSRGCRKRYGYCALTLQIKNTKGGDPSEWPADLRVREFPKARA